MNAPPLRLLSYLAPSIPAAFFERVAQHLTTATGLEVAVAFDARASGPLPGEVDPFTAGSADVGFLCSPSFRALRAMEPCPVELLAAPTFDDPRAAGAPVYFSDVVIPRDAPTRRFDDLAGRAFAFNDTVSLSGYRSLLDRLAGLGRTPAWLGALRESGSHLMSLRWVATREVDAAAIDSNVLRLALRADPSLASRVRVLESWGPYPVQPVAVRAALPPALKTRLATALLASPPMPEFGFLGFVASWG